MPRGPRCPRSAFFALGLMSTSWIVPFLMFLLVTTKAAVELLAVTRATANATTMVRIAPPLLSKPFPSLEATPHAAPTHGAHCGLPAPHPLPVIPLPRGRTRIVAAAHIQGRPHRPP